jgi:predicted amidophosphoribosyltransferase
MVYEDVGRRLVAAWKERGLRRLAPLLAALVAEVVPRPEVDAVAFVPGDPNRARWRGQNAPEALAQELGRGWGIPLERLLVRVGGARRQAGLARADRRANVRDSFAAAGPVPSRVALVDDVYTTGATVGAAASELRRAGARVVHVVALARAVRR